MALGSCCDVLMRDQMDFLVGTRPTKQNGAYVATGVKESAGSRVWTCAPRDSPALLLPTAGRNRVRGA
jgi:hypothetical protein